MQLGGCHNTPLEVSDNEKRYLDLNEIGITVIIDPYNKGTIILDISQDFRDGISLIRYSMDEHDLVLKSPRQTRSVYVGAQFTLKESHIVHLSDRVRLMIDCQKPL
ncbi:hypothetical protein F4Z99_09680 [Candidatus Poribacteria bacterium]|nr:hypothetical protein [Candidatus Poribacteria bacterium]MYB01701.1 hypothetical protein [Candidatus Poribacteria bacterium]